MCLSSGASARLRDKPNGGQARFGIEGPCPPLPSRMACQKLLTRRSECFSTQAGRLDALETSRCLASFMPIGDERSTAESHPRGGGGSAFALPSRSASASRGPIVARLYTPNNCARHALGPGKIRMFRSSKLVATLVVLLCFSFAGQAETIQPRSREPTGAGHHYIVQPRSSRVTTRGRPRTGHVPSGGAGHSYAHSTFSQPTPIHGTFAAPRWW
jgi:hypothetical protein